MGNVFNIELKNCNNVDSGIIQIHESKLNIKFGINGTGKSTIAKAIKYKIESPDKLKDLTPFKIQDQGAKPEVTISRNLKSVSIFNEEYLNQFVYQRDELISNSFEIFIKSQNYIKSAEKIEDILKDIKLVFSENSEELDKVIYDFEQLSRNFITTQTGLSKTSIICKALKDGNKLENIPEDLKKYALFLKDKTCISWLDWQIKGKQFIDISDNCPYCTSSISEKKENIRSVSQIYDKSTIKNFNALIEIINELGDYFSEETKTTLEKIIKKTTCLDASEMSYLVVVKQQVDDLLVELNNLKEISPQSLKDDDKVKTKIENLKININIFDRFKSDKLKRIIDSLNLSLDKVLLKIGELQGELNKQKKEVNDLIRKHKLNINQFLKKAGYMYEVIIIDVDGDYRLKLKHTDSDVQISNGDQYLSFGEKNAFSLVLFMYDTLSKNPDLIILDDPISSFDKNKKYAIMDMLFREDNSFKGKTVIMLTHDIEPIIDVVKVLPHKFGNLTNSSFLCTKDNKIQELEITKSDLLSFSQICKNILSCPIDNIIKVIYLRRYYESIDDDIPEYEVLSNLIHKRNKVKATDQRKEKIDDNFQKLSTEDFEKGIIDIKEKISEFDYDQILEIIKDDEKIIEIYKNTEDNFAKIMLLRILITDIEGNKKIDDVFVKFINEIYHIENDFLFQLNPRKFDVIPQFIIDSCDNYIELLERGS